MTLNHFRKTIYESVIVLIVSVCIGIVFNSFSPYGISLIYKSTEVSDEDNISASSAHKLYLDGRALFVDARYPEQFEQFYIRNSVNIPFTWSVDKIDNYVSSLERDQLIVVYCSDYNCKYSVRIAGILRFLKLSNVLIFRGGIDEWKSNSFPLIIAK